MKLTNLVTIAFLCSLIIMVNRSEAKSIRVSRELWENPRFRMVDTSPVQVFQEGFSLDNMPTKMLSKRYARIGGTIVMGRRK